MLIVLISPLKSWEEIMNNFRAYLARYPLSMDNCPIHKLKSSKFHCVLFQI